MSWDNVWPLPRSSYALEEIDRAVKKALSEFGVKQMPRDEGAEDEDDDPRAGRSGSPCQSRSSKNTTTNRTTSTTTRRSSP